MLTKDDALVDALVKDPRAASLDDRKRTMVDYAVKLTETPHAVDKDDIQKLRAAGFADVDISDINGVCAYFNMLNRVSSGLGVEGRHALPPE